MKASINSKMTPAAGQKPASQTEPRSVLASFRVFTNPVHQLIIISFVIFCGQAVVTLVTAKLPSLSGYKDALLSSLLLILIIFPALYFFVFNPLRSHIAEFKRMEQALRENEHFLQTVIETVPDCIKLLSSDGTLHSMNPAGLAMMEAETLEQVEGKSIYNLVYWKHRDIVRKLMKEVFEGKRGILQFKIVGLKGRHRWLESHAVPLRNEKGEIVFLLGITRDITDRLYSEKALLESEAKYRSLVESTEDSIYVVDRNYRYLHMNKKHITRMGLLRDEYLGRAFREFHAPEETDAFIKDGDRVFETGEPAQREYRSRRDGRYFIQTLSPVKGEAGRTVAVTVVSKDITEHKNMEEKLRALSITDELTGIYNRRGFLTFTEQLLRLSKRQNRGVFLLYADLDNLKMINDTLGHQEGDLAIIDTSNILKTTYRESDIIARIGGDEFVVAVSTGSSSDDEEIVTGRLEENLKVHNAKGERRCSLSLSFGTSYFDPESSLSIDELLARAEKAMYEQKRRKRSITLSQTV